MRSAARSSSVIASTLAVVLMTIGCGGDAAPQTVVYHVDYPSYTTAKQLGTQAELMVEATITGKPRVETMYPDDMSGVTDPKLNPEAGAPGGAQNAKAQGMVITIHTAAVTRVYKGAVKIGDVVEVKELGGTLDGVRYELEGLVPITSGSRYLLFLSTFPNSPASLLHPLQAKYTLDATGRPVSLTGNPISLSGMDLAQLATP